MADLLPSRPDLPDEDKEPRVVGLDSDEVDDLLAAISSGTARDALAALHDDPGPPSEIADRIDTSIQNAQYHLDRLESAGLIEAAGTAYSEKGREMTVYAPADGALVVVAGPDEESTGLRSALTQLLGGVGAVGLGSVVVDRLARTGAVPAPTVEQADGDGGAGGADGGSDATTNDSVTVESEATPEPTATPTPEDDGGVGIAEVTETPAPTEEPAATPTPAPEPTETAADLTGTAVETTGAAGGGSDPLAALGAAVAGLPPGALFFLGGLVALLFVTAIRLR